RRREGRHNPFAARPQFGGLAHRRAELITRLAIDEDKPVAIRRGVCRATWRSKYDGRQQIVPHRRDRPWKAGRRFPASGGRRQRVERAAHGPKFEVGTVTWASTLAAADEMRLVRKEHDCVVCSAVLGLAHLGLSLFHTPDAKTAVAP